MKVLDRRNLRRDQLLRRRRIETIAARPLGVEMSLRPEIVFFLRDVSRLIVRHVGRRTGTVSIREIRRAPLADLIDDINRITRTGEELRPALAAIGRTGV